MPGRERDCVNAGFLPAPTEPSQVGLLLRWLEPMLGSYLHDVEEDFLAQAVLAFEELMLWVGAGNVPADQLLAW